MTTGEYGADGGSDRPRRAQPTKNTGGGGFAFEDQVGAALAAFMLAGEAPLDQRLGPPTRLDFQVEADGWLLDDLLIAFDTPSGRVRCCCAIKSYDMMRLAPLMSFVALAWRQVLRPDFVEQRDLVGLVTATPNQARWNDLQALIQDARSQAPEDLSRRSRTGIYGASKLKLFESFRCPEDLALEYGVDAAASSGRLLARLATLRFDFEDAISHDGAAAVDRCARALARPGREQELWEALQIWVRDLRSRAGYVTRARLAERLGERFALAVPQHLRAAWDPIARATADALDVVPTTIADRVELDRDAEIDCLRTAAAGHRSVAVLGPSGSGKSALAKKWLSGTESSFVVWLHARDLTDGLAQFEKVHQLTEPLKDSIERAAGEVRIVIDGLDRAFDDSIFVAASQLIRLAHASDSDQPRVCVVVPCQEAEWARVSTRLADFNARSPFETVSVGEITPSEFAQVSRVFPQMAALQARVRMFGALLRPKVLDLLAARVGQSSELPGAGDEAALARWFWTWAINPADGTGLERALVLTEIASVQAERLKPALPVRDLPSVVAQAPTVKTLELDGLVVVEQGSVRFAHDLFADWVRYAVLLENGVGLPEFLEATGNSPLWHRALRLYAQGLLDEPEGVQRWASERERIAGPDRHLLGDIFLDAVFETDDAHTTIGSAWPVLTAGNGSALARMLNRFAHVATFPDPRTAALFQATDPALETYAAAIHRLPIVRLWLPVLRALQDHADDDVLERVSIPIAEVAALWLRGTPDDFPLRDVAATLALETGKRTLVDLRAGVHFRDDADEKAWRYSLSAGAERPEETLELIKAALGDQYDSSIDEFDLDDFEPDVNGEADARPGLTGSAQERLRKVLLDTDVLVPVMSRAPATAVEILIRASLGRPAPRRARGQRRSVSEPPATAVDVTDAPRWHVPLPRRGPFLAFLKLAPEHAITAILSLVEHATQAWAARERDDGHPVMTIDIGVDSPDVWIGDAGVLFWHRGNGHDSTVLASALMALEHWLYEERDEGHDIASVLDRLLSETKSVAVLGVLIELACREPALLTGPLKPLMASLQLLRWDRQGKVVGQFSVGAEMYLGSGLEPEWVTEAHREWSQLGHRRRDLYDLAVGTVVQTDELHDFWSSVRARWTDQLAPDHPELGWHRLQIAAFDPANYRRVEVAPGQFGFEFTAPPELQSVLEEMNDGARQAQINLFWSSFPARARGLLDKQQELTEDELEAFWTQMTAALDDPQVAASEQFSLSSRADLECGVAAVLIVRGYEWLRNHADRAEWCRDALIRAVASPPDPSPHDSDGNVITARWDVFCAEALPILWAAAPNDLDLRRAIARVALDRHAVTVRTLHRGVGAHREALGPDVVRLQNLAMKWAERRANHVAEFGPYHGGPPIDEQLVTAFETGELEGEPPTDLVSAWLAEPEPEPELDGADRGPRIGRRHRKRQRHYRTDIEWLTRVFDWMPSLEEAIDAEERAAWVRFWFGVAEVVAARVDCDDDEEVGVPYEPDRWALRRVARCVLELEDEARAQEMWTPIIRAGDAARHWVDTYLDALFTFALYPAHPPSAFLARWNAMVAMARGSSRWRGWSHGIDASLVGLGSTPMTHWDKRHAPLVEQMADTYAAWLPERLTDPWLARTFATFLAKDAATPLLGPGLVWLREAENARTSGSYRDEADEAVAELLVHIEQTQPQIMRGNNEASVAARDLLQVLGARQVRVALVLLNNLAS